MKLFNMIPVVSSLSLEELKQKRKENIQEQLEDVKQISLEGFFDFFKSKEKKKEIEKKTEKEDVTLELLNLLSLQLDELVQKLNNYTVIQLDFKTSFFYEMKKSKDILDSADEYKNFIKYIQDFYSLVIDDIHANISFLNNVTEDKQLLDKINKQKNQLIDKIKPSKLFKGYKKDNSYNANKNLTLYISPKGTVGLYFNNGIDKERKDIYSSVSKYVSELGNASYWFSPGVFREPARVVSISLAEYINLLKKLQIIVSELIVLNTKYSIFNSNSELSKTFSNYFKFKNIPYSELGSNNSDDKDFDDDDDSEQTYENWIDEIMEYAYNENEAITKVTSLIIACVDEVQLASKRFLKEQK